MKTAQTSNRNGFNLIELTVVVLTLAVLAGILVPQMGGRYHASRCIFGCVNNLKQVGMGFRTWQLDNNDKTPMQLSITNGGTMELVESGQAWVDFQVMSNELSTPKILLCPQESDGTKKIATTFARFSSGRA